MEDLRSLPERVAGVESQILQFRGEMHSEFSALRDEMHGELSAVRDDLRTGLRSHAERLEKLESALVAIRQDNEETRSQARMLHEEVLARIALLQEGRRRKR